MEDAPEESESLSPEPLEAQPEGPGYWVIVFDESQPPPPDLHQFGSLEQLVAFMRVTERERKSAWILPMHGSILRVTEGLQDSNLRFLVDRDNLRIPLFDISGEVQVKDPGFYSPAGEDYLDPEDIQFNQGSEPVAPVDPEEIMFNDDHASEDFSPA